MTHRRSLLTTLALAAFAAAGTAAAQDWRADARDQYQRDVQWCRENAQDRLQNCLQEARQAMNEYRSDRAWHEAGGQATDMAAAGRAGDMPMRAARADRN